MTKETIMFKTDPNICKKKKSVSEKDEDYEKPPW